jgi:hypothetical protein
VPLWEFDHDRLTHYRSEVSANVVGWHSPPMNSDSTFVHPTTLRDLIPRLKARGFYNPPMGTLKGNLCSQLNDSLAERTSCLAEGTPAGIADDRAGGIGVIKVRRICKV